MKDMYNAIELHLLLQWISYTCTMYVRNIVLNKGTQYCGFRITQSGIPPEQNPNRVLNNIHRILIEL